MAVGIALFAGVADLSRGVLGSQSCDGEEGNGTECSSLIVGRRAWIGECRGEEAAELGNPMQSDGAKGRYL